MSANTGFAAVPTWMLHSGDFSKSEILVYLQFSALAGVPNLCPSQEWLAEKTGYTSRTVREAIKGLVKKGVLERRPMYSHGGSGGRARDQYRVVSSPWYVPSEKEDLPETISGNQGGLTGNESRDLPEKSSITPLYINNEDINNVLSAENRPHVSTEDNVEEHFEEWYRLYPLKVKRVRALKAYRAAYKKVKGDTELLIQGLQKYLPLWEQLKASGEAQFIPHPSTWLNDESWTESPVPRSVSPRGGFSLDTTTAAAWQNIQQQAVTYAR